MKPACLFLFLLLAIFGCNITDKEKHLTSDKSTSARAARHDPGGRVIVLPDPDYRGSVSVEEALQNRRSIREYQEKPLTLQEVSQILWAAYGITEPIAGTGKSFLRGGLKTAPSAGGRYPLEIYLVAGHITGLSAGLYKYLPEEHKIKECLTGDLRQTLCEASYGQDMVQEAPASLVFSAVFARTTGKYGERGRSRYVPIDLGHSAENVYLQAFALGIGTCAVGAFDDHMVAHVLSLPSDEEPLYIMPLGKLH
jgi:SagB-type dehydrogenase family enzyme